MSYHDPQRFGIEHSLKVIRHGLQHDSGLIQRLLVEWCKSHGSLGILKGGGLNNTRARVEQITAERDAAAQELAGAVERAEGLLAPATKPATTARATTVPA